jgi:hypothetical protein
LRALGFSRTSIVVSFLIESLAIAFGGFAVGAALAALLGRLVSYWLGGIAFGAATFTTNVIQLRVGASDLATALALALVIGLAGGIARPLAPRACAPSKRCGGPTAAGRPRAARDDLAALRIDRDAVPLRRPPRLRGWLLVALWASLRRWRRSPRGA